MVIISNVFFFVLFQTHLISDPSPLARSKAIKNAVEIEGMKQAHVSRHLARECRKISYKYLP